MDLKTYYKNRIEKNLKNKLQIDNIHQIPRLVKIVLNVGAGEAVQNPQVIDYICNDLSIITGQKPSIRRAKKSIASFKLREGMPIGVMVTLRSNVMYNFIYKFTNIVLPRIRDFRGISNKIFDVNGNITIGIKEQLIFPEIKFDSIDKVRGLSITFVTSSDNLDFSKVLLTELGIPFINSNG